MRAQLVNTLMQLGQIDNRLIFITADLGFHAFEPLREVLKNRFINAGITEQHMVSLAAGLSWGGLRPFVFSIAPFISLKTVEQLRNDVCSRKLPVNLIGNGGGYGYGNMGPTHHVLEDLAVMQALPQVQVFAPAFEEDVPIVVTKMYYQDNPGYLRLGLGIPGVIETPPPYAAVRQVDSGEKLVMITLGPLIYNALQALDRLEDKSAVDLWAVSELPFEPPQQLLEAIGTCDTLLIVEEHAASGGLATWLYQCLVEHRVLPYHIEHVYAAGYKSGYGSQAYHWRENGLDAEGLHWHISRLLELS